MEVQQCMKLSFTNSSFGLILSLVNVHLYLCYRPSAYLSTSFKSAKKRFEKVILSALPPFGHLERV